MILIASPAFTDIPSRMLPADNSARRPGLCVVAGACAAVEANELRLAGILVMGSAAAHDNGDWRNVRASSPDR